MTARSTPGGLMLENGWQSLFAFKLDPDISIWEKNPQPPGLSVGSKIPIGTQHNVLWNTYAAPGLQELTDTSFNGGYDPAVLDQITAILGKNDEMTLHFPDESSWDFFGYLAQFQPAALQNGTHPEASCSIACTNVDPADGSEVGPSYNAPPPA